MPTPAPPSPYVAVNGADIRRRRIELGENLQTFANRVPIHFTYLSQIERGVRPRVSPRTFVRLLQALQIPTERADEIKAAA